MREGTALENDDHTKPQRVWILKTLVHVLKTLKVSQGLFGPPRTLGQ